MMVFVWKELNQVSRRYHCEGGLMVVAENLAAARVLANATDGVVVEDTDAPTYTYVVQDDAEPRVVVFPDAGCC